MAFYFKYIDYIIIIKLIKLDIIKAKDYLKKYKIKMEKNQSFIDFPQKLLKKDGETTFADVTKSAPLVGIYFSAHWCPPCRQFTPQLISFYNNVNQTQKEIEIVFVSSDQEEGEFKGYFAEMPWTAVPYDFEGREDLSENFEVAGIPTLLIFDNEGHLIDSKGKATLLGQGLAALQTWKKK